MIQAQHALDFDDGPDPAPLVLPVGVLDLGLMLLAASLGGSLLSVMFQVALVPLR
jgi:hypothetical protein